MAATAEQQRIADKLAQVATWFSGPREAILRQLAADVLALSVTSAAVPEPPKQASAPVAEQPLPPAPPAPPTSGAP